MNKIVYMQPHRFVPLLADAFGLGCNVYYCLTFALLTARAQYSEVHARICRRILG